MNEYLIEKFEDAINDYDYRIEETLKAMNDYALEKGKYDKYIYHKREIGKMVDRYIAVYRMRSIVLNELNNLR